MRESGLKQFQVQTTLSNVKGGGVPAHPESRGIVCNGTGDDAVNAYLYLKVVSRL